MTTLSDFDDYRPKPRPKRSWLRRIIIGLSLMALAIVTFGLVVFCLFALSFHWGAGETIKDVGPDETTENVAGFLYYWKIREREYSHQTTFRKDGSVAVVAQRTRPIPGLHGIRGYSESGGLHGDGTDYYEVALSPALAEEIKTKMARTSFKQSKAPPVGGHYKPDWWPTEWPDDALCYEKDFLYFVLSPSAGEAWIYAIRM